MNSSSTSHILDLEHRKVFTVLQWGHDEYPYVMLNETTVVKIEDFIPWHPNLPTIIDTPQDFIPVYNLLKELGRINVINTTDKEAKKNCKIEHPLARWNNEWIWPIANTWDLIGSKFRSFLIAGAPSCMHGYVSIWDWRGWDDELWIRINDGDDTYYGRKFTSTSELDTVWNKIRSEGIINCNLIDKLGFFPE
jgi:hypothetical protein